MMRRRGHRQTRRAHDGGGGGPVPVRVRSVRGDAPGRARVRALGRVAHPGRHAQGGARALRARGRDAAEGGDLPPCVGPVSSEARRRFATGGNARRNRRTGGGVQGASGSVEALAVRARATRRGVGVRVGVRARGVRARVRATGAARINLTVLSRHAAIRRARAPRPWKLRTRTSDSRSRDTRTTVCLVPFETRHALNAPSTENRHDCLLIQNRAKTRRVNPPFNAEFDFGSPDPRALTRTVPFKATAKRRESEHPNAVEVSHASTRSTRSETRETGIVGRLPNRRPNRRGGIARAREQSHCRDASWRRTNRARLPHSLRRPTADALLLRARVRSPRCARVRCSACCSVVARRRRSARLCVASARRARPLWRSASRRTTRPRATRSDKTWTCARCAPAPPSPMYPSPPPSPTPSPASRRDRANPRSPIDRHPVPRRGLFVVSRRFARPDREPPPRPRPRPRAGPRGVPRRRRRVRRGTHLVVNHTGKKADLPDCGPALKKLRACLRSKRS